jgi:hypothetical protein
VRGVCVCVWRPGFSAAWGEVFLEVLDIHRVDLILAGGCHGYKRVMPGGSMSAKTYFSGGVYDGEVPHLGPIQITTGGDTHICQQVRGGA